MLSWNQRWREQGGKYRAGTSKQMDPSVEDLLVEIVSASESCQSTSEVPLRFPGISSHQSGCYIGSQHNQKCMVDEPGRGWKAFSEMASMNVF
jgi:hypothetical protein